MVSRNYLLQSFWEGEQESFGVVGVLIILQLVTFKRGSQQRDTSFVGEQSDGLVSFAMRDWNLSLRNTVFEGRFCSIRSVCLPLSLSFPLKVGYARFVFQNQRNSKPFYRMKLTRNCARNNYSQPTSYREKGYWWNHRVNGRERLERSGNKCRFPFLLL